ncbi:MAG: ATP-binding protein, partial [Candidatus Nanohaloarchaea archaeon]
MEGTVIARQDTPTSREFFFVHDGVSKGAYVQYSGDGEVIARVSEVYKANEYFEDAESISSSEVKQNFPVDEWEVSIARAEIMGKFQDGMIQRVSSAPAPGTELEKASPSRVEEFLGLEEGGLELGRVQQQDVKASFDLTDTLQKHFAILAQSGAGKSYTASVMLEELLDRENAPAVLAVDPHGDYTSFAEDENYMTDVNVFRDRDISIAASNLSASQVAGFFPESFSGVQQQELSQVFSDLNRGENTDFDLRDVIARVEDREMND